MTPPRPRRGVEPDVPPTDPFLRPPDRTPTPPTEPPVPAPPIPTALGPDSTPPYDPGLPVLAEMEARVLAFASAAIAAERATAAGAAATTSAEPRVAERRVAERRCAEPGDAERRVAERSLVEPGVAERRVAEEGAGVAGPRRPAGPRSASGARATPGGAAGAPKGRPSHDGSPERPGPARVRDAGRAWPRVLRRAGVLAAIGCTVGATATALTRGGGDERGAADVVPRTVLQGRIGETAWVLRVGRRDGRICPVLSLSGEAAAGAALTTDCRASPSRGAVVPVSAAVPDGLLVAGVTGRRVRRVVVTVGGRRRAAATAPAPGDEGLRAFALVVRGRAAAPVVRPRDAQGRRTGPPVRDCAVVPEARGC